MTHPIIEDLRWRHSTKKYDATKKIPEADLDVLFEAMRLSASSINSQPWRFVVIESDGAKQRLHDAFEERFPTNQQHVFECSQIILFAHNPAYTRDDYAKVVDQQIADERLTVDKRDAAFGVYGFAEMNTLEGGDTQAWTKAQTYLALGNTLHTLARLRIDSTPIEGLNVKKVNEVFKAELNGYQCDVALAVGYHHEEDDFNAKLPKSRLALDEVFVRL